MKTDQTPSQHATAPHRAGTPASRHWALLLGLALVLLIGCVGQPAAEPTARVSAYDGALDTSYEGALSAVDQLALGTLRLEENADAVVPAQAAALLPLWQALLSGEIQGDAERRAVLRQIEATLSETQVTAIAGMRLTQGDAQTWAQSRGGLGTGQRVRPPGQQGQGGGGQSISAEERATRRAQFTQGGGMPGGAPTAGGTTAFLARAVIALLTQRSGLAVRQATAPAAVDQPEATTPAQKTATPAQKTATPAQGTATPAQKTATPGAIESTTTPAATQTPAATEAMPEATTAAQPDSGAGSEVAPATPIPEASTPAPALAQIEDTNPGPPFTVLVSMNRTTQDPVVEQSRLHEITGIVRNDGDQAYAVSDILVTFYDASGFRGTFTPAIRQGVVVGGEWHWHGESEAEFAALLLAPGEVWPFRIAIVAQDMASFIIHPDAAPTGRESASVALSDVRLSDEGTGYLRISGAATNENAFMVKNVTVSGVLVDAVGQIVSVGSTYVLEEDIAPGASVRFDLRVERAPYADHTVYVQAERDY